MPLVSGGAGGAAALRAALLAAPIRSNVFPVTYRAAQQARLSLGLRSAAQAPPSPVAHRRRGVTMAIPVGIYLAVNHVGPTAHGWVWPCPPTGALALGVFSAMPRRLPGRVRTFPLTLFTVEDLVAAGDRHLLQSRHPAAPAGRRWLQAAGPRPARAPGRRPSISVRAATRVHRAEATP
ncbi:Na+/H+ antiporter NhaA [Streptomyces sp. NPDC002076]